MQNTMSTGESKDDREKRISQLWRRLDVRKEGHIDLRSLKRSFKKIDHRKRGPGPMPPLHMTDSAARPLALKNADSMLLSIMQAVDANGDGHIDYPGKITRSGSSTASQRNWLRASSSTNLIVTRIPGFCRTYRVRAMGPLPEYRPQPERRNRQERAEGRLLQGRGDGVECEAGRVLPGRGREQGRGDLVWRVEVRCPLSSETLQCVAFS